MHSAFDQILALNSSSTALFLDFDGTLAAIVARPDEVSVDEHVLATLGNLFNRLDGALAIVSGREISVLDEFLEPHCFPASGVHGLECRISGPAIHRPEASEGALAEVMQQLQQITGRHPELLLEQKRGSVALHYRARPDLQECCRAAVAAALEGRDGLTVMAGKMVFEVKGHNCSKGTALESFMLEPPFRARRPVFLGDDVTDEAGFSVVNALGGISIKVGSGKTQACYRLADPAEVAVWLDELAVKFNLESERRGATV